MRRKSHDYMGGRLHVEKRRRKFNVGIVYEVLSWVVGIVIAIFIGVFLVYSIGIKTSVIGDSMEPSLMNGQEIYINRMIYQFSSPNRGDVIVFHPNGNSNTHLYVKRVIGLPGETIQVKQGRLYIDGKEYRDDFSQDLIEAGIAENPIELSSEEYFVLGDNRKESEDSRSADIGNVTKAMMEGKAWLHLESGEIGIGMVE